MRILPNALICGALLSAAVSADEGMWTFDHPPTKKIQDKYHFTLTQTVARSRASRLGSLE